MEGLHGLFAPIVTPFTDDGATVSEVRLARLIQHLLGKDISGLVTCTETGEFLSLSSSERKSMLELTLRESQGKPVLTHVSTMSTSSSLDLAQHAGRHGARAAILMPPYYGKYSDAEMLKYFEVVS